jgi:hypothetical protein
MDEDKAGAVDEDTERDSIHRMRSLLKDVQRITLRELYPLLGLTAWCEADRSFYERRLIKLGFGKRKAGAGRVVFRRP